MARLWLGLLLFVFCCSAQTLEGTQNGIFVLATAYPPPLPFLYAVFHMDDTQLDHGVLVQLRTADTSVARYHLVISVVYADNTSGETWYDIPRADDQWGATTRSFVLRHGVRVAKISRVLVIPYSPTGFAAIAPAS